MLVLNELTPMTRANDVAYVWIGDFTRIWVNEVSNEMQSLAVDATHPVGLLGSVQLAHP